NGYLAAAVLVVATLLPCASIAAPVSGNSNLSGFSDVSGCSTFYCAITDNGGQGTGSRVEWGNKDSPNTLTALDWSFDTMAPADDVVIAALRWTNPQPVPESSPETFKVTFNLSLDFSEPVGGNGSASVPLEIEGPVGADIMRGFMASSLASLSTVLPGFLLSDLKFELDTTNSTPGTTFNPSTGRWALPENGASTLLITADFQPVPVPGTLLLVATGLMGLAGLRRPLRGQLCLRHRTRSRFSATSDRGFHTAAPIES
ncbi:MAG: choice-of-anchor K domain-containing protein, partial [Rubrivivax sp.]|nr:choice-of-anchor K domain-containing protein [Rubrivivax sp.]